MTPEAKLAILRGMQERTGRNPAAREALAWALAIVQDVREAAQQRASGCDILASGAFDDALDKVTT